jgi:hypothetical protein
MMLAEGRSLIRQRHAIEVRAAELLGERPDYQLLRPIPDTGRSKPRPFWQRRVICRKLVKLSGSARRRR